MHIIQVCNADQSAINASYSQAICAMAHQSEPDALLERKGQKFGAFNGGLGQLDFVSSPFSYVRERHYLSKWIECVNGIAGDNFPCSAADRA
jgi:hypothetical protein